MQRDTHRLSDTLDVVAKNLAVTLGAAYTLGLDDRIGSVDIGKYADFAVLDQDPLEVAPMELRDVRVLATVLGGRVTATA